MVQEWKCTSFNEYSRIRLRAARDGGAPGGIVAGRPASDRPARLPPGGPETQVFRARARRLGLAFEPQPVLAGAITPDLDAIRRATIAMSGDGDQLVYLAPEEAALAGISSWIHAFPRFTWRLRVTTRTALRMALVAAASRRLAQEAVARLAEFRPDLSARRVATPVQVALLAAVLVVVLAATLHLPMAALLTLNLVGAVFFFGVTALRGLAAAQVGVAPAAEPALPDLPLRLPHYTVLVPLYREANMVPELVVALNALDWPRDRLDIKLLLEADDTETIAAARAATAGAPYEVVVIPAIGPRTKPKALAFALPFARGAFVTVYDAEDRPHPAQLREAYDAFRASGPDVACFQAPLVINNGRANWLTLSFAVEYAALFDGLLPLLAGLRMPLPLGGTSNHFRREALERVGGWDPYNVTEDADLGIRLARFGYRCLTLDLPTLEEAPLRLGAWVGQRTRWFKGWLQTWLVHMRHPVRLVRELGPRGTLGFLLIGTGLVLSSVIYPVYLVTLLAMVTEPLSLWGDGGILAAVVVGVNLFNLGAGYLAMAVLSGRALRMRGRHEEAAGIILLPIYWLLMSYASYRAIWQLVVRPHYWEKTPHGTAMPAPT